MNDIFNYGSAISSTDRLLSLVPTAANIASAGDEPYTVNMFLEDFPQFAAMTTATSPAVPALPPARLTKFITMALASLPYARYGPQWSECVGLYVAHFATLYLAASQNSTTVAGFLASSAPRLNITSESALGAAVSYDNSSLSSDLSGWAAWKTTTYGVQFATMAKIAGMGGMLVV